MEKLTKQQQKSMETKSRIFQAAQKIMQDKGYEQLSIKNICEEAGVSNGSFYHHFKTKDDLLSYYLEEIPGYDPTISDVPKDKEEAIVHIVDVYLNYVQYCRQLGADFMSNFYTPKNPSLNPQIRSERAYPIVTVEKYLKHAKESGIVHFSVPLDQVTTDIRMIVIGNVFEWSMKHGNADFEGNMERSLKTYLNGLLTD